MENNLLPHIKNSLPKDIKTAHVSYYPVVLEAWRRGLKIKFFNSKRGSIFPSYAHRYSISDDHNEYHFLCARGPNTNQEAIDITQQKARAYPYFKEAGVPIPEGKTFEFNSSSVEEITKYGESIGFPLVAKPSSLGGGKGVITHIYSHEKLVESIKTIKEKIKSKDVMIERYFVGNDYRFFVMNDQVIGAMKAYTSFVIGDGINNIDTLINDMNDLIKENPFHCKRTIVKNKDFYNFLDELGLTLNSIPPEGEIVFLRKHGTYLGKRLFLDCTDDIDPKFKEYAVKAINSVKGIPYGSVDMIINEEANEGVVNEINTKGEIGMHISPLSGKPKDIPTEIIDYYFPDSKRLSDRLHFEMKPIKYLFLNGYAQEIEVPKIPTDNLFKTVIKIESKNFTDRYLTRLHKKAALNHLMGEITRDVPELIEMTLYGDSNKLKLFLRYLNRRNATQKNITSSDFITDKDYHNISLRFIDLGKERFI